MSKCCVGVLVQLERIGLPKTAANTEIMRQHLIGVINNASNILRTQPNGNTVRESLLMGPKGALKVQSIWDGAKLITVKLFGG